MAAWYAIGVLTIVYVFAVVDRQILSLLAEPIRKSLGLSDTELGLILGTGVVLLVGLAQYPIGWLADRFDKRLVLCGCALVWSAAVVGCGAAQNFHQLFAAAALVGAGEAGFAPIGIAIIPRLFGKGKRQLANSIFALAALAGGALGSGLAGQIVGFVDHLRPYLPAFFAPFEAWRLSFFAAAMSAPVMVLLISTIRLARPAEAAVQSGPVQVSRAELIPYLRRHGRTLSSFYSGMALSIFGAGAVGGWLTVILMRQFGQTAQQVGTSIAIVAITSTALGFLISVYGMRYFSPRYGVGLPVRLLWMAALFSVATDLVLPFLTSAIQIYVLFGFSATMLFATNMVYPTALQNLAPNRLRARVASLQGIANGVLGAAAAPLAGLVSDQLKDRPNGLTIAAVSVAIPALLVSCALLRLCERHFVQTATEAAAADAEEAQMAGEGK